MLENVEKNGSSRCCPRGRCVLACPSLIGFSHHKDFLNPKNTTRVEQRGSSPHKELPSVGPHGRIPFRQSRRARVCGLRGLDGDEISKFLILNGRGNHETGGRLPEVVIRIPISPHASFLPPLLFLSSPTYHKYHRIGGNDMWIPCMHGLSPFTRLSSPPPPVREASLLHTNNLPDMYSLLPALYSFVGSRKTKSENGLFKG